MKPEFGYKPVNKYLPPRRRRDERAADQATAVSAGVAAGGSAERLFAWVDRMLSN